MLSSKSGSTPACGLPLNDVPSVSVPNLLPNIVENSVLITTHEASKLGKICMYVSFKVCIVLSLCG